MVSSPRIESLATRFAPYIDELHEFFRSRKVPFGTLVDLRAFPARFADPAFHEELASMVRSIVYRESAVPRTELMELVAVAVGGLEAGEDAPDLREPLRQILGFVSAVIDSLRVRIPSELPAEDGEPSEPAPLLLTLAPGADNTMLARDAARSAVPPSVPDSPPEPIATNDRLSRALANSEVAARSDTRQVSSPRPQPITQVPVAQVRLPQQRAAQPARVADPPRRSVASLLRRSYWIPGLCVLLLAAAAVFFLQRRPAPPTGPTTLNAPSVPVLRTAKPGAYGRALPSRPDESRRTPPEPSFPTAPDTQARRAPEPPAPATSARGNEVRPATGALHRGQPRLSTPEDEAIGALGPHEGVFLASSGMMAAHLLSAPAPAYPRLARFAHVEGEVIVQVVVARDGTVEATRALQGPRLLRGAAEHAIRRWRYRPYVVDGKPTVVATIVTVNFRFRP